MVTLNVDVRAFIVQIILELRGRQAPIESVIVNGLRGGG
jgi:hypothetical protein